MDDDDLLYRRAFIPKKHWGARLSDYRTGKDSGDVSARETVATYLKDLHGNIESGRGLLLAGPPGAGKTMLASIVLTAALDAGYSGMYLSLQGYIQAILRSFDLKNAWSKMGDPDAYAEWKTMDRIIERAREVRLLVVDDVGKEHTTSTRYAEDRFDYLVRSRYDRGRTAVMTTNLQPEQWGDRYSSSMMSVIQEAMEEVAVVAPDFRSR